MVLDADESDFVVVSFLALEYVFEVLASSKSSKSSVLESPPGIGPPWLAGRHIATSSKAKANLRPRPIVNEWIKSIKGVLYLSPSFCQRESNLV